jgi:hypothetical protein
MHDITVPGKEGRCGCCSLDFMVVIAVRSLADYETSDRGLLVIHVLLTDSNVVLIKKILSKSK